MSRTIHLITNPFGGTRNNQVLARQAVAFFKDHGIKVTSSFTEEKGHAVRIAQSLNYSPEATLCGLGGDGTIHEIINGNMLRPISERLPISLLPGGTGNSFLEDLGIFHFEEALRMVVRGNFQPVDLFKIRLDELNLYVFNVCGWGLFASGNARAESLRFFRKSRYHVAGFLEILRNKSLNAKLIFGEKTIEDRFSLIAASNTRNVGKSMLLSPKAKYNDGKLDLTFLKLSNRIQLMRLFSKLPKGTHIHESEINHTQCKSFEIHSPIETLWNLDGEVYSGKCGKVHLIPDAVNICI